MRRAVLALTVVLVAGACGGTAGEGTTTTLPPPSTTVAPTSTSSTTTSTPTTAPTTTTTVVETTTTTIPITEPTGEVYDELGVAPLGIVRTKQCPFPSEWAPCVLTCRATGLEKRVIEGFPGGPEEVYVLSCVLGAYEDGTPFERSFMVGREEGERSFGETLHNRASFDENPVTVVGGFQNDLLGRIRDAVGRTAQIGIEVSTNVTSREFDYCRAHWPENIPCQLAVEGQGRVSYNINTVEALKGRSDAGVLAGALPNDEPAFGWAFGIHLFPPPGGWPPEEAPPYALVERPVESPALNPILGTLIGTLTLTARPPDIRIGSGESCQGVRDAADIVLGLEVVVRDPATGRVLGQGVLEDGVVTGMTGETRDCQFTFAIPGLGAGWDMMTLEVGDGSRGSVRYTLDEVAAAGWAVALGVEQP